MNHAVKSKAIISPKKHFAVIFDLDGVITKTAITHAAAWKHLFDSFLKKHAKMAGRKFEPFDSTQDYLKYVDGKPRYDGITSFLESRSIEIPFGNPEDSPKEETVCGMANKKNLYFLEELEKNGIEVYFTTIELIKQLKNRGIKIGLISSSKNCATIIEKVGVADLFDAKIDGLDSARMGIKGKPEPDVFLRAADQLGVEPKHTVIIEDAISGVQAGRRGGFAEVIGIDRSAQAEDLLENGADVVVKDLIEVVIEDDFSVPQSAVETFEALKKQFIGKEVAIFLDYDGTLSPITSHPDLAELSAKMRKTLKQLANHFTVAIISGRDRKDVEKHVKLNNVFYAGSHGFDIAGPGGKHFENQEGNEKLPQLDAAEEELKTLLAKIKGAWLERKKYSLAVHFRQVSPKDEKKVEEAVRKVHHNFAADLRVTSGKKIFELQPAIQWNKGKALHWLLNLFGLDKNHVIPIYIGDDVTDEDAFKALIDNGIGIAVQEIPKQTAAKYILKDPEEVRQFLNLLLTS